MSKVIPISSRGQITIPTELRKKLNVQYVICRIATSGDLVLSPLKTREDFLKELDEAASDWEKNGGISLKKIEKELRHGKKI